MKRAHNVRVDAAKSDASPDLPVKSVCSFILGNATALHSQPGLLRSNVAQAQDFLLSLLQMGMTIELSCRG